MFPVQKCYRVLLEPIFKSRLKGWDHSRKLNCDSSFTINLNTCHKADIMKYAHHRDILYFIFYIWWLAKKLLYLCQEIIIYSCSGVLDSSVLSLGSPTIRVRQNVASIWLLFYQKSLALPCNFHNNFFLISTANLVLASAFSEQHRSLSALIHNQQCSKSGRAQPQCFIQRSHPMGVMGDFAPLEFKRGFVYKAEFVTRKAGINNCVHTTGNNLPT